MALRLRKDIKKSSYYVWFLGAKESQGLRGEEYIVPVVKHLIEREKDVEPFKVTLQVSHKGLKIVQNIVTTSAKNAKQKNEIVKHFIPHNTITCVLQNEDIVACILLLFNPVTKCPLHVHAYRCDSLETAALLKSQLQILIERPENQKKFVEFEQKLKIKQQYHEPKFKKRFDSSLGSDTGTSTRESESSEERYTSDSRIATLYDSLAAELRKKLGKNDPILLPPRDYDTVHRQKGNLDGIETRRSLNANIVGMNVKNASATSTGRRGAGGGGLESCGGSSGIGSDHAPSPDGKEDAPLVTQTADSRYNMIMMDNQSSSDDDWNHDPTESTIYLMHGPSTDPLPRIRSTHSGLNRSSDPQSPHRSVDRVFSSSMDRESECKKQTDSSLKARSRYSSGGEHTVKYVDASDRYHDNETSFHSTSTPHQNGSKCKQYEQQYVEQKIAKERPPNRSSDRNSKYSNSSPKSSERRYAEESRRYSPDKYIDDVRDKCDDYNDCPRYFDGASPRSLRRRAENRQRSPSPDRKLKVDIEAARERIVDVATSPRDRFKDAKEKFLLLEKQRLEEQEQLVAVVRRAQEKPISPVNMRRAPRNWDDDIRDKKSVKRHDSIAYKYEETNGAMHKDEQKYYDERRRHCADDDNVRKYREQQQQQQIVDEPIKYRENATRKHVDEPVRNEKTKYFSNRYDTAESPVPNYNKEHHPHHPAKYVDDGKSRHFRDFHGSKSRRADDKAAVHGRFDAADDRRRYRDVGETKKRHDESENSKTQERYYPKPAPRNHLPVESYRDDFEPPLERYRSPERYRADPKRRSMLDTIEDERRRNSNEIAKELKRRSYMESRGGYYAADERYYRNEKTNANGGGAGRYAELNERDRYPGLDRDDCRRLSKSTFDLDKAGRKVSPPNESSESALESDRDTKFSRNNQHGKNSKHSAGYRHSYAEPKLRLERIGGKKLFPDILHRTDSSVSNSGRVGIASIHPY